MNCTICGKPLIPGENWYAMKTDHTCTDCTGWPHYYAEPKHMEPCGDYEEAILARQEYAD